MVGEEIFSEPQGPENLQNRSQPRQRPSLRIGRVTGTSQCAMRVSVWRRKEKAAWEWSSPRAQRRSVERIGHTIRIFERRRRLLPGTVLRQSAAAMPDQRVSRL